MMEERTIKRHILFLAIGFFLFFPCMAAAHGDHDHPPLTDADFLGKATYDVSVIVDDKEAVDGEYLDESWKKIGEKEKEIVKKTDDFVIVSFYHREKKRTLYVLLTIHIEYLGANFNGRFKGI